VSRRPVFSRTARTTPTTRTAGRRRRWLIPAVVVVVVIVAALVVYVSPLFHVRSVEVEGTRNLSADEVQEASGVREGENLVRLDTGAAASRVSGLPWTDSVTVSRSWPSTVHISVTEHEAVGVIDDGGQPAVVDRQGRVFLRGVTPDGVKPVKARVDDSGAVGAAAKALAAVSDLDRGLYDQIASVDAPGGSDVRLLFPEGREVYWGSGDRAPEKAEATRIVLTRDGTTWNVSNPALPSVRD
jgi:cell division protein FtsQ